MADPSVTVDTAAPKKIFVNELNGSDEDGLGTQTMPYKTAARALESNQDAAIFVKKTEQEDYAAISGAALKKAKKKVEENLKRAKKLAEQAERDAEKEKARAKELALKLMDAKNVVLEEDPSLPKAVKIQIRQGEKYRGQRVKVSAWVHRLHIKGKDMMFVELRDGSGFLQCVLTNRLCHTYDALTLTLESTVTIYGVITELPEGKTAPGNHELVADYWEVIAKAPSGDDAFTNKVTKDLDPSLRLDMRHLVIRSKETSSVLKVRSKLLKAFRQFYEANEFYEVNPPKASLTQSSQLYLETCLPSLGNVFCIAESYRAEKSNTRRHLSQYTHLEGELPFITFTDLLAHLEDLICVSIDNLLADPEAAALVRELHPEFEKPSRPFMRLDYVDALAYLKANNIVKEDGSFYEFGDDIPEAPERAMTDKLGRPIMLINFPVEIKSFYMKRAAHDRRVTESVDILLPGVGEIVGGSMRIDDLDELTAGFEREGIDPTPYYWYKDMRKYGSCPHGGYGLGVERILAWLCKRYTVRDCCLYPRFVGRCAP
ncbi:asparagine--tRNA ligase [Massospora cicadina]|nr:asparagine--tRNA ligase [Massospora cicadina]